MSYLPGESLTCHLDRTQPMVWFRRPAAEWQASWARRWSASARVTGQIPVRWPAHLAGDSVMRSCCSSLAHPSDVRWAPVTPPLRTGIAAASCSTSPSPSLVPGVAVVPSSQDEASLAPVVAGLQAIRV